MSTGTDELNDLGYVSSAPDFSDIAPIDKAKSADINDLTTMEAVMQLLADRKAYYRSIDAVSLDEKNDGKLREQIKDNKRMLFHIQELEGMLTTAINKVRSTFNG